MFTKSLSYVIELSFDIWYNIITVKNKQQQLKKEVVIMKNKEALYRDFIHYGEVEFNSEHDFTKWGGSFYTIKVIKLNGVRMMFILGDGEVKSIEYLGVE